MEKYQPKLLLVQNGNNEFILHSTTLWDTINVQSAGATFNSQTVDGILQVEVELNATSDAGMPELETDNFLVHTVNLGTPFEVNADGELNGEIEATIYITNSETLARNSGGKGTIKKISTKGHTRPTEPIKTQ